MKSGRYAAIVLAGGRSTRMRQLKPLLSLGDTTVADHAIGAFLSAGVDVCLVTGYQHDKIRAKIKNRGITVIYNSSYEQGMFSSVQAGIKYLQPAHQAFFILPVDIPLVRPATIKQLMNIATEEPDKIVYPVFKGKRGHPPLIPAGIAPAILKWNESGGLKTLLRSREKLAREVLVADSFILSDIDTLEDYTVLRERFRRYELPTEEECDVIMNDIGKIKPKRIRHDLKVAKVAVAIGQALDTAGHPVDVEIIRAAAVLHDVAKGQRKHDIQGGELLRKLGFGKVGDIVGVHSDLAGGNTSLPLETKIVYLADKFVLGQSVVSLEERYSSANRRFALMPEIEAAIAERLKVARSVKQEFEKLLGYSLESVIS